MSDIAIKVSQPVALQAKLNEDWLAVVIGLAVFGAALASIGAMQLTERGLPPNHGGGPGGGIGRRARFRF